MANYLRPRRGRKSAADEQNFVLMRGEIFFEAPESGVGTGLGRIKIGDGTTAYTSLPYFYDYSNFITNISEAPITFTETAITSNTTLLNKIVTGAQTNIIIGAVKNLLANLNNSSSSKRFKTNIKDMDECKALDILKLRPVTFDYLAEYAPDGGKDDWCGLIAEEVEPIIPHAVTYRDDKVYGLDYSKIVPQLIKLCQMQQKRIDDLEEMVNDIINNM